MKKIVVVFCMMLLFCSGCTLFQKKNVNEESAPSKQEAMNQAFYGFPDIPVPKELEFVRNKSFVYETPNLRAGVMYLSGNVDLQSVENYFKVNMIKNGWKFINSFKYKDVTMNFTKEDRSCNIKMSRESFNTDVEVWVGPIQSDKGSMQKGNDTRGTDTRGNDIRGTDIK